MLNVYRGRESLDKEKFIYEKISENNNKNTIVIVPDQYTLVAERQALSKLGVSAILGIEIKSISRLGDMLFGELGGVNQTFIDKTGRHMLLSQILFELKDRLQVFGESSSKETFVSKVNDFISEVKNYGISPKTLHEIVADKTDESSVLLQKKLADLDLIFDEYEKKMSGKYTDSEDLLELYKLKISKSKKIKQSSIWIYGFDSFTPKNLDIIGELIVHAREVNVVLTCDSMCRDEELFELTQTASFILCELAKSVGKESRVVDIKDIWEKPTHYNRAKAISTIERELFAVGNRQYDDSEGLHIVRCANVYNEAESVASYVLHLLRDKGYRYRDIAVICNDQASLGSIIRRMFDEYGIRVFDDRKRNVASTQAAVFVVALIDIIANNFRTTDIMRFLKTGLSDLSYDEVDALENYVINYKIKGTMWKNSFTRGISDYKDEGLKRIEDIRRRAIEPILEFEKIYRQADSVKSFSKSYYIFLTENLNLKEKLESLAEIQKSYNMLDIAEETEQIWETFINIMRQIDGLLGDEKFNGLRFSSLLSSGFSQVEIGVIPPSVDDITLGTMQRTRIGDVKAVLVVGANEGMIPMTPQNDGLFNFEDLDIISSVGQTLGDKNVIKRKEENIAIYRMLSKASEELYLSYSATNGAQESLRKSEIVYRVLELFPNITIENDVLNRGDIISFLGGEINTLRHYTKALGDAEKGCLSSEWRAVESHLSTSNPNALQKLKSKALINKVKGNIPGNICKTLFSRNRDALVFSPSRLEKFRHCAFSHFISYGLHPKERRPFEVAGIEIGDFYHEVIMKVSMRLNENNSWDTVTRKECDEIVEGCVEETASKYRDGVFSYDASQKYLKDRAAKTCASICWILIEQRRTGAVNKSLFEVPFGRGYELKPIVKRLGETKVFIEGKIDRLDILNDGSVKVIDYKTGDVKFDINEVKQGHRLQLMIYLEAAKNGNREAAGTFYFRIFEPRFKGDNASNEELKQEVNKKLSKGFRLSGILADEDDVIRNIAGEFHGDSSVLNVNRDKTGKLKRSKNGVPLMSRADFEMLQEEISDLTSKICEDILDGKIDTNPQKIGDKAVCNYCEYKSICGFDISFDGCDYVMVK